MLRRRFWTERLSVGAILLAIGSMGWVLYAHQVHLYRQVGGIAAVMVVASLMWQLIARRSGPEITVLDAPETAPMAGLYTDWEGTYVDTKTATAQLTPARPRLFHALRCGDGDVRIGVGVISAAAVGGVGTPYKLHVRLVDADGRVLAESAGETGCRLTTTVPAGDYKVAVTMSGRHKITYRVAAVHPLPTNSPELPMPSA